MKHRGVLVVCIGMLCLGACGGGGGTAPDDGAARIDAATIDAASLDAPTSIDGSLVLVGAGGPCDSADDCLSGVCATESERGVPGGACVVTCDPAADTCAAGTACLAGAFGEVGACVIACDAAAGCRTGFTCYEYSAQTGVCRPDCTADTDCTTGQCNEETGTCIVQGAGAISGAPCAANGDCESGVCFVEADGSPGGRCTQRCDPDDTASCPAGGFCEDRGTDSPGVYGACSEGCAVSADCRAGYSCFLAAGDHGYCFADCSSDSQCTSGQCNEYTGFCEPLLGLLVEGAACDSGAQCESHYCLTESTSGLPGGTCSSLCALDGNPCPGDSTCEDLGAGGGIGSCFDGCASTSECRAGWSCWAYPENAPGECRADCTAAAQCPAVGACNVWSGFCGATTGAIDGAACTSGADCASGNCWNVPPGGYCISNCSPSTDNCPADGDGVRSSCFAYPAGYGDWGYCLDGCDDAADCRTGEGYGCFDLGAARMACLQ